MATTVSASVASVKNASRFLHCDRLGGPRVVVGAMLINEARNKRATQTLEKKVGPPGLEPGTNGLKDRYSNQLS